MHEIPNEGPPLTPAQATAALDSFETDDTGWHDPPSVGLDFDQSPPAHSDNEGFD